MALKAVIEPEEFQRLSEPLRREYVLREDGYYLDVLPVALRHPDGRERTMALEDVTTLKLALSQVRTRTLELGQRLAAYEGIDDPQAAREAMAQVQQWAQARPDERLQKQQEAIEQQLEHEYYSRIKTLRQRAASLEKDKERLAAQAQRLVIAGAATTALLRREVLPQAEEALVEQICRMCQCRRAEIDGRSRWRIEVLDDHGNVRISNAVGSVEPMSIEELAEEMKAGRYAFAFGGRQVKGEGPGWISDESQRLSAVERLKLLRRVPAPACGSHP